MSFAWIRARCRVCGECPGSAAGLAAPPSNSGNRCSSTRCHRIGFLWYVGAFSPAPRIDARENRPVLPTVGVKREKLVVATSFALGGLDLGKTRSHSSHFTRHKVCVFAPVVVGELAVSTEPAVPALVEGRRIRRRSRCRSSTVGKKSSRSSLLNMSVTGSMRLSFW